jgi:hypothetical protein
MSSQSTLERTRCPDCHEPLFTRRTPVTVARAARCAERCPSPVHTEAYWETVATPAELELSLEAHRETRRQIAYDRDAAYECGGQL